MPLAGTREQTQCGENKPQASSSYPYNYIDPTLSIPSSASASEGDVEQVCVTLSTMAGIMMDINCTLTSSNGIGTKLFVVPRIC